ncbi:MAG: class II aldolase/adducin family protein [Vulcanimicrobiaceae bacterium]
MASGRDLSPRLQTGGAAGDGAGSGDETASRRELVRYAALVYARGLAAGASGNLSLRLGRGELLATPSGRSLRALAPEELVRLRLADGAVLAGGRPTSELPLHLAAYRARPDARALVHAHPSATVAWTLAGELFGLGTVGALESLGPITLVAYHRSGTAELAQACAAAFAAGAETVVMERHGLSSLGPDLESAFVRAELAEQTARIELDAALLRAAKRAQMDAQGPPIPPFPLEPLRAATDDPATHARLAALDAELARERPDPAALQAHAKDLGGQGVVAAAFERWWLDPRVQAFIAELSATGL